MTHSYVCHDSRSSPKESTSHEQKSCARCFLCCFLLPVSSYSSPTLQCGVVRCSVLQYVAVRCSALQCVAVRYPGVAVCCKCVAVFGCLSLRIRLLYCSVLCIALCCSMLQCVTRVLQCNTVFDFCAGFFCCLSLRIHLICHSVLHSVLHSALPRCCSVMQRVAVRCSVFCVVCLFVFVSYVVACCSTL